MKSEAVKQLLEAADLLETVGWCQGSAARGSTAE